MKYFRELLMVGRCIEMYRSGTLTALLRVVSLPGDGVLAPVVLVILAAALVFIYKKDKIFATVLALAPLVGNAVKYALKQYFAVPRPEAFGCDVLVAYGDRYSFPSGHTVFYTIFFGLLVYFAYKNWQELWAKFVFPLALSLVLLIGYSRVYLGAHWYLDVLAGYILGGCICLVAILIYKYWEKKSV